jgi:hypothetical protein
VPLFADPTYTSFQVPDATIGTYPNGINLSGTVIGTYIGPYNPIFHTYGTLGFVRDSSGTITTLNLGDGVNGSGVPHTAPTAINSAGTIVGELEDYGYPHSFMLDSKGTITRFDPPQCSHTMSAAAGINAEGAIVGVCIWDASSSYVRKPDGTFQTFEVKGAAQTWAVGINMAYLVTGYYYEANSNNAHGFVGWPNSNLLTTFDPPGSVWTKPTSINSFGAITGSYRDAASVDHGFVRNPLGKIVSFDPVGSTTTYPAAINDAGVIVGGYKDSNGFTHGFIRDLLGTITSFDMPGSVYTRAVSINDHGVITGVITGVSKNLAFVRTP